MLQKIKYQLLCAGLLFSANTFAMIHALAPGVTVDYDFPPNEPQIFANYWIFPVNATCVIKTEDSSNPLHARLLSKKAKINGKAYNAGDSETIIVRHGEKMTVSADSGASVELTNLGEHTVIATCSSN